MGSQITNSTREGHFWGSESCSAITCKQGLLIKTTTMDKSRGAPALPQSTERLIKQGRLQHGNW